MLSLVISLKDCCKAELLTSGIPPVEIPTNFGNKLSAFVSRFERMDADDRLSCGDAAFFLAEVRRRLSACRGDTALEREVRRRLRYGMAAYAASLGDLAVYAKHVNTHNVCSTLSCLSHWDGDQLTESRKVNIMRYIRDKDLMCKKYERKKCRSEFYSCVAEHGSPKMLLEAVDICKINPDFTSLNAMTSCFLRREDEADEAGWKLYENNSNVTSTTLLLSYIGAMRPELLRKLCSEIPPNEFVNTNILLFKASTKSLELLSIVIEWVLGRKEWKQESVNYSIAGSLQNSNSECLNYLVDRDYVPTYSI